MPSRKASSFSIVCLAAIICACLSEAAEPKVDPIEAELVRLGEEYDRLEDEWVQSIPNDALEYADDELSDDEYLIELRNIPPGPDVRLLPRFLAVAELHPDSPFALDALSFAVRRRTQSGDIQGAAWQAGERALDLVAKHHMDDPRVTQIFGRISRACPTKKSEALLRTALAESPDRATQAAAAFSLARYLQSHGKHHQISERIKRKSRLTNIERVLKVFLVPYLERECPYDHEKSTAEIDRILALVIEEYADVKVVSWNYSGPVKIFFRPDPDATPKTYGELARLMRFELEHLTPGKKAPEIEGTDAEGNTFRLSDYRGKVVLLTFSANWCGPCRRLYPTQRELVEKFRGDAFALLSVTRDEKVDTLKASLASGEITWRCWWDGAEGPIWLAWNPPGTPSIFLLDERGIIQDAAFNQATPPEEFERTVADLLEQASASKTPSR